MVGGDCHEVCVHTRGRFERPVLGPVGFGATAARSRSAHAWGAAAAGAYSSGHADDARRHTSHNDGPAAAWPARSADWHAGRATARRFS